MTILLIDDHQMFREGLMMYVASQRKNWTMVECSSIEEAKTGISGITPDVVVSDLHLKGDGPVELMAHLTSIGSKIPVMVLSMDTEKESLLKVLKAGARGFITKDFSSARMITAIEDVAKGEFVFDGMMSGKLVQLAIRENQPMHPFNHHHTTITMSDADFMKLTDREKELFWLLIEDLNLPTIADIMGISLKTVENHRSMIYKKLGMTNRLSLFHYARRHNQLTKT